MGGLPSGDLVLPQDAYVDLMMVSFCFYMALESFEFTGKAGIVSSLSSNSEQLGAARIIR